MNADYIRPFLSPKTNFLCHANLKVFSPLMSAARGPKPSVAPKPKVTPRLNGRLLLVTGSHGGCTNGSLLHSDNELEEETEAENRPNKEAVGRMPTMKYFDYSSQKDLLNSSQDREGEEEDVSQKMEEDWALSDSALTEEVDSPETLWVSDAGLTADSEDAEEMIEMDMTEDMVMDGCDAGEALADTEGLSVGDISVTSVDEEAACYSGEKVPEVKNQTGDERQTKHQIKEDETADSTADDLTESLTEEEASDTQQVLIIDGDNNEAAPDCGITCSILKLRCSHKMKEKEEFCAITVEKDSFIESLQTHQKKIFDTAERCIALESDLKHEPYYVSSEDIIKKELYMRFDDVRGRLDSDNSPCGESVDSRRREYVSSEDYADISGKYAHDDSDDNKRAVPQDRLSAISEENKSQAAEELLNFSNCELRFGLASMLSDADTSLTSSASESQLLSLSNSDVFTNEEDLQGCRGLFLDDTTDTEQELSDEPVYEDARHRADSDNTFSFNRRTTGMRSRSQSQRINNNLSDTRVEFFPRPSISGFQAKPTMSSSPMLNKIRYENYSKPNILSLYPRSLSMEGQDMPLWVYKEREASLCSSGSFSRCSPLSSSGFSTPTSLVDIPPPFELACITKRPITKSSPSLLIEGDSSEKNRKKKSSIKHFLMKFRRKSDSKPTADITSASSTSSAGSRHQTSSRVLDLDSDSLSSSPQLNIHFASKPQSSSEPASTFLLYKDNKRKGNSVAFLNRSVARVESFEDRSRVPFTPLPLTKPRSISFPNTDTSDYENVPPISSDYENLQVPRVRPVRQEPFTSHFERPWKAQTSANDTDGYVDMSSLPGFDNKSQSIKQETESAYTETYNMCSLSAGPLAGSMGDVGRETADEEDQGQTSEEEERWLDINYDRQPDGRSRAFYIAKELADTERLHVKSLKLLQEDFREAVGAAVGDEGEPVLTEERLREILNELPDVYTLHRRILTELENRIRHWEESERIADIFLSRRAEFLVFTTYIGHYDRSMNLLDDSCQTSPGFALTVHQFESTAGGKVSLKHQLLQVIIRVAQYRMLLTDYLNNLSPDSKEYEDTQAAVAIVSDIADQVNDSLKHGENLLRLVNIEYSVRGQWDLLQPGRVFVKEGTLMKVSRKSRQPRHLFLMNDVLLYTYPQQDGKYRLKNTFSLTGLKVSKPIIENVQNTLKVEGADTSITLSASSFLEREDWFYTLSRTVAEHARGPAAYNSCSAEVRDSLRLSLGEKAPTFVPVSHVMMCMNCTSDFSLTLRRHHCHSCGRIVCQSCSRNRYPLKYMKDRMAKVCDHCYNELKKRGGDVSTLTGKNSPRPNRSSRPLSSMFQNIHPPNIWRHRKGAASLTEVTVSKEGSISGSLQRSKRSRRTWKRLWFLLKDKVLYTYRAQEETVASESLPLLGFTVKLPHQQEGEDENTIFQLYHKNTLYYTFKAEDNYAAQRWVTAMEEATVL